LLGNLGSRSVAIVETTRADESTLSAVSWAAILAGGVASAALTLLLLSLGTGIGLSVVSPWSDWNITAVRAATAAGIFAVVVGVMSSAVGGYIAGRLRSRWVGVHTDEIYFRDTAHGLLAWAFATVLSAGVMGTAATRIVSSGAAGLAPVAAVAAKDGAMSSPLDAYVDRLLRPDFTAAGEKASRMQAAADRAEVSRLLAEANRTRADLNAADPRRALPTLLIG
jgi:hypothetical protein